jgi:hypothetical protein
MWTEFEANREKSEAVAEHQKVHKEEAAVDTIGSLVDWPGDRHLDVGRRRQPKKMGQGDGVPRKKLVAARRRMTRRADPAPRKGHFPQGPGKDDVEGTSKRPTFGKRRQGDRNTATA